MTKIPFTQYLRPNGKKRSIEIEIPNQLTGDRAEILIAKGYHFDAEVLRTNEVCLTVGNHQEDIGIEICPNGPEVLEAVTRLVDRAYRKVVG